MTAVSYKYKWETTKKDRQTKSIIDALLARLQPKTEYNIADMINQTYHHSSMTDEFFQVFQ